MTDAQSRDLHVTSTGAVRQAVTVCICTFKRPALLKQTLSHVLGQGTANEYGYSVVVVDNDVRESAREIVLALRGTTPIEVTYCVEPEQNIALARNRALQHAAGDFVALIDDDEYPSSEWLLTMLRACHRQGAAGVLGPVRPVFDVDTPPWLIRSGLCERPEYATGYVLHWTETRTGNVLFRREILKGVGEPFDPRFGNGGEDKDFFRRMIERGHRFVWCNEAIVYEVVPPERSTRRYVMRRALLRGQNEELLLTARSIIKSLVAVPLYIVALPVIALAGQHTFMRYAVRLFDHLGKLAIAAGVRLVRGKYLNG